MSYPGRTVGAAMDTVTATIPVEVVDFLHNVEAVVLDGTLLVARCPSPDATNARVLAALLALP